MASLLLRWRWHQRSVCIFALFYNFLCWRLVLLFVSVTLGDGGSSHAHLWFSWKQLCRLLFREFLGSSQWSYPSLAGTHPGLDTSRMAVSWIGIFRAGCWMSFSNLIRSRCLLPNILVVRLVYWISLLRWVWQRYHL